MGDNSVVLEEEITLRTDEPTEEGVEEAPTPPQPPASPVPCAL